MNPYPKRNGGKHTPSNVGPTRGGEHCLQPVVLMIKEAARIHRFA